jgi:hypothetical protein
MIYLGVVEEWLTGGVLKNFLSRLPMIRLDLIPIGLKIFPSPGSTSK